MKLTNVILAILTGLITIAAIYGIAIGKTHQIFTAFIAAFVTFLLIADAKKVKK